MNKLLALVVMVVAVAGQALAQQKPQFTQYALNNFLLNPALSGIEDYADVRVGGRHQWSGLEGAPETYYTSVHMPLNKDMSNVYGNRRKSGPVAKEASTKRTTVYRRIRPHHGIGALAMSTRTGMLKRSSLGFSYAYHQPLTRRLRVSAGVSPGLTQYNLDPTLIRASDMNDPALYDGRVNETKFDLNMGLWLYSQDFYIGVAGAQLVPSKREFNTFSTNPEDKSGKLQKHFFTTAGYRLVVAPGIAVIPSVMVKMAQPSPVSIDTNVRVIYADRVWAGISYRHKDAIAAMAGVGISPLLDIAYAYDASTSALGISNSGSHEVIVGFKLRNIAKVHCPQWAW